MLADATSSPGGNADVGSADPTSAPLEPITEDGERLAALALGLAASWLPPERRLAELRAATCPVGAAAAVEALERRRSRDPVGVARAVALLARAHPGVRDVAGGGVAGSGPQDGGAAGAAGRGAG